MLFFRKAQAESPSPNDIARASAVPRTRSLCPLLCANLVQTCHGKFLPVVASSTRTPNVFSNGYLALLLLAAALGRFEPRRPRQPLPTSSDSASGTPLYLPVPRR